MFIYDLGFSSLTPIFLIGFLVFTLGVGWTGVKNSMDIDKNVHYNVVKTDIKKVA